MPAATHGRRIFLVLKQGFDRPTPPYQDGAPCRHTSHGSRTEAATCDTRAAPGLWYNSGHGDDWKRL